MKNSSNQPYEKWNLHAEYPWGPSNFINQQTRENDQSYLLEMQSGDIIQIEAGNVSLLTPHPPQHTP